MTAIVLPTPERDLDAATDAFLALVHDHPRRVDGVKVSLLDAAREVRLRERLPDGVRLYTGDDVDYPTLIAGGSHALLGIFDPIAPAAAAALQALDAGDPALRRRDRLTGLRRSASRVPAPVMPGRPGRRGPAWTS